MLGACAVNKVILMGRLTADPELRQTQTGTMTCHFTVAITRNQSSQAAQSGQEAVSDFIRVTAFNKTAEFVSKYFAKGKLILVEGALRTGSYADRNHPDVTHYTTDVWADNVSFGETKSSSQNSGSYNQNYGRGNAAPAPQAPMPAGNQGGVSVSVGDIGDYEEILSENNLPF